MNARLPGRPAGDSPSNRLDAPCEPSPPGTEQGGRRPLTAAAGGNPAGEGGLVPAPSSAGPTTPGGAAGASGGLLAPPGSNPVAEPEALSGKAFRDALKAAQSAKAKRQRNQRARPWIGRDPLRKAVPGGRKPPPEGEAG